MGSQERVPHRPSIAVKLTAGAVVTASALAMANIGSASTTTARAAKVRTVSINIVDGSPGASTVLPYFAMRTGIFRRYHINATVSYVGASLALSDLASGKSQFGVFGAPVPEEAAMAGSSVKWLGVWDFRSDLQLVAAPGITSVSQLKGKSIAISAPGSVTNTFAAWVMQQNSVPVGSVSYVPLQTASGILAGFVGGSVDALLLGPPFSTEAVKGRPGSTILLSTNSKSYAWPFNGIAGYMPWVGHHKNATVRIMEAMTVALHRFFTDPAAAEAAIMASAPGTSHSLAVSSYKDARTLFSRTGLVPSESTEKQVLKLMQRFYPGRFPGATPTKWASFIDSSYAEKAATLIGS